MFLNTEDYRRFYLKINVLTYLRGLEVEDLKEEDMPMI